MTDFLDVKRKEINDRLAELKPLVEEYTRLQAASSALDGVGGTAAPAAAPARRGPGRPKGSTSRARTAKSTAAAPAKPKRAAAAGGRRAGRRKGSGTRAAQALSIVAEQPGVTIPELAARMGIKQNYLYRVLPGLEQENKVSKQGRGWHPGS